MTYTIKIRTEDKKNLSEYLSAKKISFKDYILSRLQEESNMCVDDLANAWDYPESIKFSVAGDFFEVIQE